MRIQVRVKIHLDLDPAPDRVEHGGKSCKANTCGFNNYFAPFSPSLFNDCVLRFHVGFFDYITSDDSRILLFTLMLPFSHFHVRIVIPLPPDHHSTLTGCNTITTRNQQTALPAAATAIQGQVCNIPNCRGVALVLRTMSYTLPLLPGLT